MTAIEKYVEAMENKDYAGLANLFSPDGIINDYCTNSAAQNEYHIYGREAINMFFRNIGRSWNGDIWNLSPEEMMIGGIEASLRRLAHYDYWSNKVKHSILVDSQADLISYGMGEKSIVEIADALNSGLDVKDITFIDGTVYKTDSLDSVYDAVTLPSYDEIKTDKRRYAESFNIQYKNTDAFSGKRLVEQYRDNL